jgi:hypothetical protein
MSKVQLHALARSTADMHNASTIRTVQLLRVRPAQQLLKGRLLSENRLPLRTVSNQH